MTFLLLLILFVLLGGAGFVFKVLTLGTGSFLVLVFVVILYLLWRDGHRA